MISSSLHKMSRVMHEVAPIAVANITNEAVGYEDDIDTDILMTWLWINTITANIAALN